MRSSPTLVHPRLRWGSALVGATTTSTSGFAFVGASPSLGLYLRWGYYYFHLRLRLRWGSAFVGAPPSLGLRLGCGYSTFPTLLHPTSGSAFVGARWPHTTHDISAKSPNHGCISVDRCTKAALQRTMPRSLQVVCKGFIRACFLRPPQPPLPAVCSRPVQLSLINSSTHLPTVITLRMRFKLRGVQFLSRR